MLNIYKLIIFILLLLLTKKCKEKFTNQDKNKNILIIGATSKIGQVILKNDNKHNYFLLSRDKKNLENLQNNMSNKINSTILTIDFSNKKNIDLFFKNELPKFDIVFNNFYDSKFIRDINYQFNTNISNNIYFLKKIFPYLNKNSKLINISSGLADNIIFDKKQEAEINYSIVKSVIEKYTKILSNRWYHLNIGVSCLKIDDSYKSELTKKMLPKIYDKLKEPDELVKCFDYFIDVNWREITGRIINSSNILKKDDTHLFDLEYSNLKNESTYKFLVENKYNGIGENIIYMSPLIDKYIKENKFNFSKYSSEKGKLRNLICQKFKVNKNQILYHNGLGDFMDKILSLFVKKYHNIIASESWDGLDSNVVNQDKELIKIDSKIKNNITLINFPKILNNINANTRIIYLVSPIFKNDFNKFIKKVPKNILIIIDFCYQEYFKNKSCYLKVSDICFQKNSILCLFTFSKFYSLPDLRLSFSITSASLNNLLENNSNYPISSFKENIAYIALIDKKRNNYTLNYFIKMRNYFKNLFINKTKFYFTNMNSIAIKLKKKLPFDKIGNILLELEKNYVIIQLTTKKEIHLVLKKINRYL